MIGIVGFVRKKKDVKENLKLLFLLLIEWYIFKDIYKFVVFILF